MSKIKNWMRIKEGNINYDDKFKDSRFDREVKPIVWQLQSNKELFYVVYKNPDGYYISEYVGLDAQDSEVIGSVEDEKTITSKTEAHNVATEILERHPFPFNNYDRDKLKERTREVMKQMYAIRFEEERNFLEIGSLQGRSNYFAKLKSHPFKLWVDWEAYESSSYERRIRSLIHELAHYRESHHKPPFWYEVFSIYDKVENRIDHHYPRDIDWEKVAKLVVKDIHKGNLDMRTTTVGEMRNEAEDWLGVNVDDRYPRDESVKHLRNEITLRYPDGDWEKSDDVELPDMDAEMLWNWVESNFHKVTVHGKEKYYVDIPTLSEDLEPVTKDDKKILGVLNHYNQSEKPRVPYQKV